MIVLSYTIDFGICILFYEVKDKNNVQIVNDASNTIGISSHRINTYISGAYIELIAGAVINPGDYVCFGVIVH